MGHATTTKLELEDDDAFFVNVGDLEVEESDMTKVNYDPLKDVNVAKVKRKKAPPSTATASAKNNSKDGKTNGASPSKKGPAKKAAAGKAAEKLDSAKKEKPGPKPKTESSSASTKVKTAASAPVPTAKPKVDAAPVVDLNNPVIQRLKAAEERARKIRDDLYRDILEEIKGWNESVLPKKGGVAKKIRVAITVPEGKKSGDTISFANPHKPDQKLRATIPVGVEPLGKFHVQIPAPEVEPPVEDANTSTTMVDHNKIPRESYDKFDDYARAYDEWADAEGAYKKAIKDKEYSAHKQKRNKFDELVHKFPKDLKTPIDKAYMQRVIRRARQNKHKKAQIDAKKRHEDPDGATTMTDHQQVKEENNDENDSDSGGGEDSSDNNEPAGGSRPNASWESCAPKRGRLFATVAFDRRAFDIR
jgi:hypothetical protein